MVGGSIGRINKGDDLGHNVQRIKDLFFHEATVRNLDQNDQLLRVSIDDAVIGGSQKSVDVEFVGISSLVRDGVTVGSIEMELPDGEILTFLLNDHGGELIVEWNDFSTRRSLVRSYTICCDKIEIRIL